MELSRRRFLGGSVAAIGALGAARMTGLGALPQEVISDPLAKDLALLDDPVMLSVTNSARGEFELLVGEVAIPVVDKPLVAKLARAIREGNAHVVPS